MRILFTAAAAAVALTAHGSAALPYTHLLDSPSLPRARVLHERPASAAGGSSGSGPEDEDEEEALMAEAMGNSPGISMYEDDVLDGDESDLLLQDLSVHPDEDEAAEVDEDQLADALPDALSAAGQDEDVDGEDASAGVAALAMADPTASSSSSSSETPQATSMEHDPLAVADKLPSIADEAVSRAPVIGGKIVDADDEAVEEMSLASKVADVAGDGTAAAALATASVDKIDPHVGGNDSKKETTLAHQQFDTIAHDVATNDLIASRAQTRDELGESDPLPLGHMQGLPQNYHEDASVMVLDPLMKSKVADVTAHSGAPKPQADPLEKAHTDEDAAKLRAAELARQMLGRTLVGDITNGVVPNPPTPGDQVDPAGAAAAALATKSHAKAKAADNQFEDAAKYMDAPTTPLAGVADELVEDGTSVEEHARFLRHLKTLVGQLFSSGSASSSSSTSSSSSKGKSMRKLERKARKALKKLRRKTDASVNVRGQFETASSPWTSFGAVGSRNNGVAPDPYGQNPISKPSMTWTGALPHPLAAFNPYVAAHHAAAVAGHMAAIHSAMAWMHPYAMHPFGPLSPAPYGPGPYGPGYFEPYGPYGVANNTGATPTAAPEDGPGAPGMSPAHPAWWNPFPTLPGTKNTTAPYPGPFGPLFNPFAMSGMAPPGLNPLHPANNPMLAAWAHPAFNPMHPANFMGPFGHPAFGPFGHPAFGPFGHPAFGPFGHPAFGPFGHPAFGPFGHPAFNPMLNPMHPANNPMLNPLHPAHALGAAYMSGLSAAMAASSHAAHQAAMSSGTGVMPLAAMSSHLGMAGQFGYHPAVLAAHMHGLALAGAGLGNPLLGDKISQGVADAQKDLATHALVGATLAHGSTAALRALADGA